MLLYEKHIFICINSRDNDPARSCGPKGGEEIHKAFKEKLAKLGLAAKVRANKAGCLNACQQGVALVIYPQGIWYGHVTLSDVDEIIEKSIIKNEIIKRLELHHLEQGQAQVSP